MIDIEVKHMCLRFSKEELIAILQRFNRTLDDIDVDVKTIKDWIQTQPHLSQMPEDRLILSMLLRNKFAIEKTKCKIDNYYSIRSMMPQVMAHGIPTNPDIREIRKIERTFTLPELVNLNRVIFFVKDEMRKFDPYTYVSKILIDSEALIYHNLSYSLEVILDYSETNLAYWTSLTPTALRMIMFAILNVYSSRCHALRIIGLPTAGHAIINIGLKCLSETIKKRITMHSNRMEMAGFYPRDQLPVEYGGEGAPYREMSAQFDDMVDQCEQYFLNIQNFRVDPKLRPTMLDNSELLGFYGNFRKLDVD